MLLDCIFDKGERKLVPINEEKRDIKICIRFKKNQH